MISFITGKPGDGKSLFATRQLLEDLINTEVFVVTNIPLVLSRVNEYVTKRRTDRQPVFVLDERVKVIPDAEVYEFYRHRSGDLVLNWSPDKEAGEDGAKRIPRPDFVQRMKAEFSRIREQKEFQRPCHFYIDEAHNFFSSREWATNGRGLLYYASQHRHLWDNIYLITQVMENVEKQLRSLVSETHQVRNQLRRRIGPIRMRPVFRVQGFYGVPAGNIKPFATTTFDLDPARVAACYKTVGALGVHDTPEASKNKAPLPWWCLPVGGALLVVLIGGSMAALPFVGMKAGAGVVRGSLAPDDQGDPQSVEITRLAPSRPGSVVEEKMRAGQRSSDAPPYPTGYAVTGRKVIVQLSDGTVRIERDAELSGVERNSATISGEKLFFRPAPRLVAPEPVQPLQALPSPPPLPAPSVDQVETWDATTGPVGIPSGRIGR